MTATVEPPGVAARRTREAERLRENLRRRKAQAWARQKAASAAPAEEESPPTNPDDTAATSDRS